MKSNTINISANNNLSAKSFLFVIMIFLFFLSFNSAIIHNLLISLSDEIFLILSTLIIFYHIFLNLLKQKIKKIYLVFLFYLIYQFINYYVSPFTLKLELVVLQSLINIKVFLVAFAILIIWQNNRFNRRIVKNTYYLFIVLFSFGMLLNFALQESWNILIGNTAIAYRYGFIRPVGWLGNPAQNGYFFAITFVTLYLLYSKSLIVKASLFVKKFFVFIIVDFLMAFPLSVRKGMMMTIPFGFTTLSLLRGKKKFIFIVLAIIFLSGFLFIIKDTQMMEDTIMNLRDMTTADDNSYIRGLMIYHGASLFLEFFPFGVGDATFGTVLSQYNTLDVYNYVGLDLNRIYYNEGRLSGVYDSGLFSMLAENGFIGMLLMFSFIYYFFKFNKKKLDPYNYIVFKIITWFAILLSLTEPVWQNGLFTVIYVMNLLFIYTKNNIYRQNKMWVYHENTPDL